MTTAHSLTWTLFLLAQHPQIMRQLWLELSESAGNESTSADGEPIGPKAVGALPKGEELSLLDRVIKESMRLLPASAYSQRMTMCGVQVGPLYLSRGTAIVFTPLVTHHLAELYPEPERFLPDRWLTLRPSPYAYHPFGGGPRLCIGGPLATAIIRLALQHILSRFRLTVVPGSNIGVHVESTMLVPTNGVPMEIAAADGNYHSSQVVGSIHELVDFDNASSLVSVAPRRPK
jgi:cytochrome P450